MKKTDPQSLIKKTQGESVLDLLIKDTNVLDLVNCEIISASVAISDGVIVGVDNAFRTYKSKKIIDGRKLYVAPGFIDAHLHIESSMMHPYSFERATLKRGTIALIADPHEIINVLGEKGLKIFLDASENMKQHLLIQLSSCVPALKGFENNGGDFTLEMMKKYIDHKNVLGLGEMMNYPGVINGHDDVLDKILFFKNQKRVVDGHAPLLTGASLNAYALAGISNCHESTTVKEAKEKMRLGIGMMMREGTVAKNLKNLAKTLTPYNSLNAFLCTDDRNVEELVDIGHIDSMIRDLIKKYKVPSLLAYRVGSYSTALHYGLDNLGLIAPGKEASFVLLNDVDSVDIKDVLIKGELVSTLKSHFKKTSTKSVRYKNSIKRKHFIEEDFKLVLTPGTYRAIEIIPNEIITKKTEVVFDGSFNKKDILKIVVAERYGQNLPPTMGLVKGFGFKNGAIASSIAHDSHNLIAISDNNLDLKVAMNALIDAGGGMVISHNGKIVASLFLPLAGLMTFEESDVIYKKLLKLKKVYHKLGGVLDGPFLQMAFLSLPVIPHLKITDIGLFDVDHFEFVSLGMSSI